LQWADAVSLELLDDLVDRHAPLLVFATARPELGESHPDLFAGRDVLRIEPRGLVTSDVAHMARAILGRDLPDAVVRAVAERTAGNPFFVKQIVLELGEGGALESTVARSPDDLPLPLTVEAAVQSRLDHLPPAEKDLVRRASVYGRSFSA